MRLSHLNALRALEAAIRLGSFSAASHELGVSPAAVGQRIKSLEDYLGCQLFQRSSTGTAPSVTARRAESLLTTGITNLSAALELLRQQSDERRLAVTLPASFAEHWLAPSVWGFYRRHEDIELRLDATNRDVDLVAEDFDFAIRFGRQTAAPLAEVLLFGDAVLPVCSPRFLEQYGIDPDQRSLDGIPLIHVDNRTSDPGWVGFDGWGAAFGFEQESLRQGVRYSSFSSGLKSAIDGQGLVLSGLVEAYNAIRAGLLVMPFDPAMRCRTHFSYRLIWVANKPQTKLQTDFVDWLLEMADLYRHGVRDLLQAEP
ncbi:LysR family transcriptional regulator [Rhodobacterales bacterium HKCCSP123]|nr:LysR family transcriptional regulator [Rhodobacterales bacterium HKCCSP123]